MLDPKKIRNGKLKFLHQIYYDIVKYFIPNLIFQKMAQIIKEYGGNRTYASYDRLFQNCLNYSSQGLIHTNLGTVHAQHYTFVIIMLTVWLMF